MGYFLEDYIDYNKIPEYAKDGTLFRRTWIAGIQQAAALLGMSRADMNRTANQLSGLPLIGDMIRADAEKDKFLDYMKNTGLGWEDVKYPALVNAGQYDNARLFSATKNFVSRNIYDLYK